MKAEDIQKLKQLSRRAVKFMPRELRTDANKYVYMNHMPISIMDLLEMIDTAEKCVLELDEVIQEIKIRKSLKNNAEHSSVGAGENG